MNGSEEARAKAADTMRGIALVMASSAVVAFVPSLAKLAYEGGATPQAVIAARYPIAIALLAGLLLIAGGTLRPARAVLRIGAVASVFALMGGYGFMASVAYIDVSLAILIFYLHPVFIGIYGHIAGHHRLNRGQITAATIAMIGLTLALAVDLTRLDLRGVGFAFMGAIGATVMTLTNAKAVMHVGTLRANLQMTVMAGILMVLVLPFLGELVLPATGLGWLGLVGSAAGITLTFVLFFAAVPLIGTTRATVISILEPVLGILVALVLFGEWLAPLQWFGVLLVVGGLLVMELPGRRIATISRRLLARSRQR